MSALADHLAGGASSVCRAWTLRRKDGVVMGFTDHDRPLTVAGVPCLASSGLSAGALQSSTGLSVDNVEAVGALSSDAITESDLRAGRWDSAEVTTWLVNWASPDDRTIVFRGTLGEISWGDGAFSAELRGLSEALNRVRGRVYQSRCDAVLGDRRCTKNLADERFRAEAIVSFAADNRVLTLSTLPAQAEGWFERGLLTVLDGTGQGLSESIKSDRIQSGQRRIELWSALRAPIAFGTSVRLQAGCDKRMETCQSKFDNFLNYRGFPHVPGDDWLMAYPTTGSLNDGGKR